VGLWIIDGYDYEMDRLVHYNAKNPEALHLSYVTDNYAFRTYHNAPVIIASLKEGQKVLINALAADGVQFLDPETLRLIKTAPGLTNLSFEDGLLWDFDLEEFFSALADGDIEIHHYDDEPLSEEYEVLFT
jgi:hypothetical protein